MQDFYNFCLLKIPYVLVNLLTEYKLKDITIQTDTQYQTVYVKFYKQKQKYKYSSSDECTKGSYLHNVMLFNNKMEITWEHYVKRNKWVIKNETPNVN